MISRKEKLLSRMMMMSPEDVNEVFTQWESGLLGAAEAIHQDLRAQGWQQVEATEAALPDGREVYHVGMLSFVMPMEMHEQRLKEAFDAAASRQPPPGEALASVLCPACQSIMAKSPICPNCEKGRQGFKILCTCTECAHEVYL